VGVALGVWPGNQHCLSPGVAWHIGGQSVLNRRHRKKIRKIPRHRKTEEEVKVCVKSC